MLKIFLKHLVYSILAIFSLIVLLVVSLFTRNKRKEKIGYLPKEHSEVIARLIDAGKKIYALSIPNDEGVALKIYMNDQE